LNKTSNNLPKRKKAEKENPINNELAE